MMPLPVLIVDCRYAAGSSADIRKAAAQQVANVALTHPPQLPSLLRQVGCECEQLHSPKLHLSSSLRVAA